MKLKILKEDLELGLELALKIIQKTTHLPILSSILIKAQKGSLEIRATNLEEALIYKTLADIEKEGELAVKGEVLYSLVNSTKEQKLELEKKENTLEIKTQDFKVNMLTLPKEDFPIIPEVKGKEIQIDTSSLIAGISQVIDFVATTQIRPELSGVLLEKEKEDEINFVASDSFRLGKKQMKLVQKREGSFSLILPAKSAKDLLFGAQKLKNISPNLRLILQESQVAFSFGSNQEEDFEVVFISQLIEGEFPDYKKVIPNSFEFEASILKKNLQESLKSVGVFSNKSYECYFKFIPQERKLILKAESSEIGRGEFKLGLEKVKGDKDLEIVFNYKFILEGLGNLQGEMVDFKVSSSEGPSLLFSPEDPTFIYLVMPIKKE